MAFRRLTYRLIVLLWVASGLWCPPQAAAAPPQFRAALKATTTRLSPFPVPERKFIFALTLDEYFPLAKSTLGKEYDISANPKDSSLTYTRNFRKDQSLIPVSNDVKAFVNRRVELSLQTMSAAANQGSLVKDQQNKAGGLFNITIPIRSKTFETLFGEGGAGLKVSGYRKITFSGRSSWTDGQSSVYGRQSKFPALNMEQVYRFDITGTIGSKISVSVSQDSRNDLPLANRLILRYKGNEDDVLQSIEAGNTTLDLPATQFLRYSTRVQGLFGLKATAKIADLSITAIASQEKGSTESVEITAGSSAASTRVIRDVDYRKRTIFDLGRIARDTMYWPTSDTLPKPRLNDDFDFFKGDSITLCLLYVDDKPTAAIDRAGRTPGVCYVDPRDTLRADPGSEYTEVGDFETIDETSYYINAKSFYVVFTEQVLGDNDIMAAFITVKRAATGLIDTIGDISRSDTLRLKLIKPTTHTKLNHHVWDYEWRNVYSLSSTNIDLSELDINVFKGTPINNNQDPNPDALDYQDGLKYLQLLGLDRFNESNEAKPDGQIDRNAGLVDASLGLLVFGDRHPFDSRQLFAVATSGDTVRLREHVSEIYTETNQYETQKSSEYYMTVATKDRGTSVINLNSTNIIEGSEVVTYNGTTLKRDEDYSISYEMGRLTLLKDEYTDVNANLSVMFETAPFFSLSRKTLLGTRFEYAPSRNFKAGATLLYKSDKATNRKPKVGEETSKMMVWDADMSYNFEVKPFTAFVNALPFVSTQAASNMRINAEVAQSRPNPNVDGSVYIDDFEGSDEDYSLGVRRGDWRFCSRPAAVDTSLQYGRGHVSWDTRDNYTNKEIWNREEGQGTADIARVLVTYFKPDTVKLVPNTGNTVDTIAIEAEKSWNGFMKDIPSGIATQLENSQLLEMRVRGDVGIIHIDLGRISDDINGNGVPDSEDKNGNRTLEDDEDTGLDGKFDKDEPGGDDLARNPDPNGDNYDENNIWKVNGTEGNRTDITFGGTRPDMENPDYDGFNKNNDYFSYRIDLSDTTQFYVPGTRNDANWKTIRIPLRDVTTLDTVIGEPAWNEIRNARIWFDSLSVMHLNEPIRIEFASIDLVSNAWADSLWVADSLRGGATSFDVAVINDEIDKTYRPPAGVSGYYDATRDVTEKEQSLLLRYENLNARVLVNSPDSGLMFAADTAMAVRKFIRANNYMGYGKLEAYVHGPATA
ncbi:MAG: cell surface protein SprA, partial [candidate division Zixibacteria bacterium]|nr:cell surface protein SprA [candidate division Zixibacteria bacterium]